MLLNQAMLRDTEVPPAIQHIRERSVGPAHRDGRKIALVVQGGAMRGIFTAGALCALEGLGLRRAFDVIYASSGGAVNAAYFLSDQIALGTSIYASELSSRTFIDFRRILTGTAADIGYCFDEVVGRRKRLDLEAVQRSSAALTCYVTSLDRARPEHFIQHEVDSSADLLQLLKASAAMPLVYRRPVLFRGDRYLDGGILAAVPLLDAIADGCSDILVLLSRPLAPPWKPPQAWLRWLIVGSTGRRTAGAMVSAWLSAEERLEEALNLLRGHEVAPVNLACVAPAAGFPVNRWTIDQGLLVGAARAGALAVLDLFGGAPESVVSDLLPRQHHAP